jgi:hypothetical protein
MNSAVLNEEPIKLPLARPDITEADIDAVASVL